MSDEPELQLDQPRAPRKTRASHVFAVDLHAFDRACELGLNEAVAYLVIARGSGGDNRTSSWSVNAIEKHTGLSRPKAIAAVDRLVQGGLVDLAERAKRKAPRRFFIVPAIEIPEADAVDDQAVWVWLPNRFVAGATTHPLKDQEIPPLELLRQTQSPVVLRLMIHLYHAHDLVSVGGVPWQIPHGIRRHHDRKQIGERGPFVVWGFSETRDRFLYWGDGEWIKKFGSAPFTEAMKELLSLGLVLFVPHLVENADHADAAGEVMFPLCGCEATDEVWRAATSAGRSMLTEAQAACADEQNLWLIPVKKHLGKVGIVDILQMRYRPHTEATAIWLGRSEAWLQQARTFRQLALSAPAAFSGPTLDLATSR